MDWNKFIFPQPQSTYTRASLYGQLIGVPRISKYSKQQIQQFAEHLSQKRDQTPTKLAGSFIEEKSPSVVRTYGFPRDSSADAILTRRKLRIQADLSAFKSDSKPQNSSARVHQIETRCRIATTPVNAMPPKFPQTPQIHTTPKIAIRHSPRTLVPQTLCSKTPRVQQKFKFDLDSSITDKANQSDLKMPSSPAPPPSPPVLQETRQSYIFYEDEGDQFMKVDREQAPISDSKLMRTSSRILEKKPIPGLDLTAHRRQTHQYHPRGPFSERQGVLIPRHHNSTQVGKHLKNKKIQLRLNETTHHSFTAAKECFKETPSSSTGSNITQTLSQLAKIRLSGIRTAERGSPVMKQKMSFKEFSKALKPGQNKQNEMNSQSLGFALTPKAAKKIEQVQSQNPLFKETRAENIPCLYIKNRKSSKLLIYFHGNAEDIGCTKDLLEYLKIYLGVSAVAVQYPGYGVYRTGSNKQPLKPSEDRILEDASCVFSFFTELLGWRSKDIIIMGRSIGTGPAIWLSAERKPGALALISPHTSIRGVVRDLFGLGVVAQFLVNERFRNLEIIKQVTCPTFILHGEKDKLIPPSHSQLLCKHCAGPTCLLKPKKMDHNSFSIKDDLCKPLRQFLGAVFFEQKKQSRAHKKENAKVEEDEGLQIERELEGDKENGKAKHNLSGRLVNGGIQARNPPKRLCSSRLEPKGLTVADQIKELNRENSKKGRIEKLNTCFPQTRVPTTFFMNIS